jgi:DNA-binding NtrC family response regulator
VNENVLLIGKDSSFMGTLSERISSNGVAVNFAQTAPEALAFLLSDDIDVVVINVNDLGASGIRILDSMKQTKKPCRMYYSYESLQHPLVNRGHETGCFCRPAHSL